MRTSLGIVAALLFAAVPAWASAQDHCSRETLSIRGTPVTIAYCTPAGAVRGGTGETVLEVSSTFSAPGGTVARTNTLRFVGAEGPSRVLENVELAPLGLTGTLHLTLVYSGGFVRVESAILTPGAITIK